MFVCYLNSIIIKNKIFQNHRLFSKIVFSIYSHQNHPINHTKRPSKIDKSKKNPQIIHRRNPSSESDTWKSKHKQTQIHQKVIYGVDFRATIRPLATSNRRDYDSDRCVCTFPGHISCLSAVVILGGFHGRS